MIASREDKTFTPHLRHCDGCRRVGYGFLAAMALVAYLEAEKKKPRQAAAFLVSGRSDRGGQIAWAGCA
jgi:hypothetical protein